VRTERPEDIATMLDEVLENYSGSYSVCLKFKREQLEDWIDFMRSQRQTHWGTLRNYVLKDGTTHYLCPRLSLNTALCAQATINSPDDSIYFIYLRRYPTPPASSKWEVAIINGQPPLSNTLA